MGIVHTSYEQIKNIFQKARNSNVDKIIIHIHGGLVSRNDAIEQIESTLLTTYQVGNIYPLFVIWETSIQEVIAQKASNFNDFLNKELESIFSTPFFKKIRIKVAQVVESIYETHPDHYGSMSIIDEFRIRKELKKEVPLEEYESQKQKIEPLKKREIGLIKDFLKRDIVLRDEAYDIKKVLEDKDNSNRLEALYRFNEEVVSTLDRKHQINKDAQGTVLEEFVDFFSNKIIKITINTLDRIYKRTDHGIYPTIIEEIIRSFYLDKIGKLFWQSIKQKAESSFQMENNNFGGLALLNIIKENHENGYAPEITLVGHSAGAIFTCNLIKTAEMLKLNEQIKFNVIFLGPACSFRFLEKFIPIGKNRIKGFKIFNLSEAVERKDYSFTKIYPLSILYLLSALFEENTGEELLGLQIHCNNLINKEAQFPNLSKFYKELEKHVFWSPRVSGIGNETNARNHSDLAKDKKTLNSIIESAQKSFI